MSEKPKSAKQQRADQESKEFEHAVLDQGHVPLGPMAKARAEHMRKEREKNHPTTSPNAKGIQQERKNAVERGRQIAAPAAADATRVASKRKK